MARRAVCGVRAADRDLVLVDMIAMRVMKVAVVQEVLVTLVIDARVATPIAVNVLVVAAVNRVHPDRLKSRQRRVKEPTRNR